MGARMVGVLLLLAAALTGCATTGTRTGHLGALARHEPLVTLVTLVISEDPTVVRGECPLHFRHGGLLGCQTSRRVVLEDGRSVRVLKIARYTDRLPSALAFEIELHELCHAAAALQGISDFCHVGNEGVALQPVALPRRLMLR